MEASGPVFEIFKFLLNPLARRIRHANNLKQNFEKLKKEARELYDVRNDINLITVRSGKVPTSQFQTWSKDVEEIEDRINAIDEDYKQCQMCCRSWCPYNPLRMKLGKQMVALIDNVSDLKGRVSRYGGVMVDAPPRIVEMASIPRIKGGASIDRTLMRLSGFIQDAGIQKIGIWGMGGVGKTTLMKNLNNLSEIAQMFDIVIWVTVSRDFNLRKVQNEIARRLSLNLASDISHDGVSRSLYHRLEDTKYLLLLDDVWDKVNLEDVGIPMPSAENECKIVLTTRSRQVCNKMETDVEVRVEILSEDEAWELFHEKVGSVIDSPSIQPLVRSIVNECGGLPLAIIVVGGALRKVDDVRVWKNALKELSLAATWQIEDMEEVVFKTLRFSYEKLKDSRKSCFLYAALYQEAHGIAASELIEYWRAAGLIEGSGDLSHAVDRGHAILNDLLDASLLECHESGQRVKYVRMHDVFRDLALRITSGGEGCRFLVRSGLGLENPPENEEWEECDAVSFMYNKLSCLPKRADCPILSTLLLQYNSELTTIPDTFFEFMPSLRVLDLSGTSIKSLPPSICNLVRLRGIYLNKCMNLTGLPSEIGSMVELEVLHLKHTRIRDLPIEVGRLSRLKCLQVSFYSDPHEDKLCMMVLKGMLSGIPLLENLRIVVSKYDKRWALNVEDVIAEVGSLKKLSSLQFCFRKVEHLEYFMYMCEPWKKETISNFHFIINASNEVHRIPSTGEQPPMVERYLRFENGDHIPHAIQQVLSRAEHFVLLNHTTVEKLSEFGMENFIQLRYLEAQKCNGIETLIDRNCLLPKLESLWILDLPSLRNIWEDRGHGLPNLRVLSLSGCDRLKNLLSNSMIQGLPNLELLRVGNCDAIREILEGDVEYVALPKLKILDLLSLKSLARICERMLAWPSIEKITIFSCENLRILPFGSHNASTIKSIQCDEVWWDALHWDDDEAKNQLQPFFTHSKW